MDNFLQSHGSFVYGIIAIVGGCARYFVGYTDGRKFSLRIFLASAFVSGFSGWMFALMGLSMGMPQYFIYMMAGVGGFMGEKALNLIVEYVNTKI